MTAARLAEEVSAPAAGSRSCSRCGAGSRPRRGAEVAPRGRSSEAVRGGGARTARRSRRRSFFRSLLCGLASQGSPSSQAAPLAAASCAGARVACSPLPAGGAGAGLVHRVSEGRVPRDRPLVGVAAGTGPAHSRRPSPGAWRWPYPIRDGVLSAAGIPRAPGAGSVGRVQTTLGARLDRCLGVMMAPARNAR